MITVDDALAIDAVFQCIYGVHRLICRGIRHAASTLQSFCFCSILVDFFFAFLSCLLCLFGAALYILIFFHCIAVYDCLKCLFSNTHPFCPIAFPFI